MGFQVVFVSAQKKGAQYLCVHCSYEVFGDTQTCNITTKAHAPSVSILPLSFQVFYFSRQTFVRETIMLKRFF